MSIKNYFAFNFNRYVPLACFLKPYFEGEFIFVNCGTKQLRSIKSYFSEKCKTRKAFLILEMVLISWVKLRQQQNFPCRLCH